MRKALVNAQVAESKTVFWSWKFVKIHSQLSRELLLWFFLLTCCSENSGTLQTDLNDMEENFSLYIIT